MHSSTKEIQISRNGAGQYNLPVNAWNPAVNGVSATPTDWQALINDVASALTQSVSSDGQTPMTGNLQLGNNKVTGLATATNAADAVTFAQLQAVSAVASVPYGTATGTDTIALTISPPITSYTPGQSFRFIPVGANTGTAVTINVSGVGAIPAMKRGPLGPVPLAVADFQAPQEYSITYEVANITCTLSGDGTNITVTTQQRHGLVTGALTTISGASVSGYNVGPSAITVLTPTTFTVLGTATGPSGGTPVFSSVHFIVNEARFRSLATSVPSYKTLNLNATDGDYVHIIGNSISSITGSGTTITVTTAVAHGLATNDQVITTGASATAYNVTQVSITVTGTTSFTFPGTATGVAGGTPLYSVVVTSIILQQGEERTLAFDTIGAITGGASLILTGQASSQAIAIGDTAIVRGEASGVVRFIVYQTVSATQTAQAIRQTVLMGSVDASGLSNWLSAGTGLAINMAATVAPVDLTFASGFNSTGSNDFVTSQTTDIANKFGAIAPNITSYLFADFNNNSAFTGNSTTIAPQYGNGFDRTRSSLLHFDGTAGATTILDDWGNTWTAQGGAKLQSNSVRIGTTALGGGGTANALNGSSDYVQNAGFAGLGGNGWTMRGYVNFSSLPSSGVAVVLAAALNSSGVGANLYCENVAGTIKIGYNLSSNGSSNDIGTGQFGFTTPVVGTYYYVELTFDAVAGVYRLYVAGTQEKTVTSSLRICATSIITLGWGNGISGFNSFFNGYMDEFEFEQYCDHPGGTAYTPPTIAGSVNPTGKLTNWFDVPNMLMREVSGPSTTAGTNPTFTTRTRLFVGEADAGASTISAVRSYAYRGMFDNANNAITFAASTVYTMNHNIGVPSELVRVAILSRSDRSFPWLAQAEQPGANISRSAFAVSVPSGGLPVNNNAGGSLSLSTATSGQIAISARRAF